MSQSGSDDPSMQPSFGTGESGDGAQGPPIETIGARYGISVMQPSAAEAEGAPTPTEPYLMPSVAMRNGGTERVADSIGLTPLGGLMPGPNAIAPAIPSGEIGTTFAHGAAAEVTEFGQGVRDSWPEGTPVPIR